ncbi:cation-translocating P-type ATPase, partial [Mycoplasma nasistruthionis]|uniref:cation-translocating P-type ATPase n=1 Tax=Mycoplasma nasistruthionis TaxID=353852 RepID=UPI0021CB2720
MIILLLIAAAFSFGVTIWEHSTGKLHSNSEIVISYIEPFIILIVVALNSMLGTYQEIKSDQAVKALQKSNELNAKVIRDGKSQVIKASEVTIGDIILLEAGDSIPADARLVEAYSLSVVESVLTGESLAVDKKVGQIDNELALPLGDRYNYLFSGTYVVTGKAVAIVEAIGEKTEMGKINQALKEQEIPLSPLQIKLNKLSTIFGISGVVLLFVTVILQLLVSNGAIASNWARPESYLSALVIGISLAVAAIPEGLITFTTVLLAIGVSRMTKQHAVIKSFPIVETLGSTNIICSDKTGTLTQNKMTVVKLYDPLNQTIDATESKVLGSLVACCDAEVHYENNQWTEVGDPTETAILRYGIEKNNSKEMFYQYFDKLSTLPFDSDRKTMSVLVSDKEGNQTVITKGAPDVIFNKITNYKDEYKQINDAWSNEGIRVIAVAYKKVNGLNSLTVEDENELTFLGLIGMIDPPRENVKLSIEQAKEAG